MFGNISIAHLELAVAIDARRVDFGGSFADVGNFLGGRCLGEFQTRVAHLLGIFVPGFFRLGAHVTGRLIFNSSELIVAAALSGHGLAWLPLDLVQEHIAVGRLMSVLDEWAITFAGYHAYYAGRRASPALMLVVEALRPPGTR